MDSADAPTTPDARAPGTGTGTRANDDDESPPARVGRYVLAEELGRGGFGVVHAAHDPELDRRVAVKLLRRHAALDDGALRRLAREARALAALQHPNVVGVFDVGRIEDPSGTRLYLVMELVEGASLRAWLRASPRSHEEILAVLVAAGRGLAAAHAAGIVHRDFKPGNVLVGASGMVKVADFGLARAAGDDEPASDTSAPGADTPAIHGDSGLEAVTEHGVVMGTPPYMAPEQLESGMFDARADQFALAVTAWEALTGELPFPSDPWPKRRLAAIRAGECSTTGHPLPPHIEQALRRGLAYLPGKRHASVEALLGELRPTPRRNPVRVASLAGLAVVTLGVGTWWVLRPDPPRCLAVDARLAGIWDDPMRTTVREAFERTSLSYAADASTRLVTRVDAHVERWSEAWTGTCGELAAAGASPEVDRRLGCLREQLGQLAALSELLAQADAEVVERGTGLVETLDEPAICEHAQVDPTAERPAARRAAELVRGRLAKARVLAEAGRFEPALATITDARTLLADTNAEVPGLALEIDAEHGVVLDRAGRYAEAAEAMSTSYFAAADAGRVELAARLAIELVVVYGYRLGQPEEGLQWARHADTDLRRSGDPTRARAELDSHLGMIHFAAGELEQAHAAFSRAAAGLETLGDAGRGPLARVLQNLASVELLRGDREDALQSFERALDYTRQTLGPGHPNVALILGNLGQAQAQDGDLLAALEQQQEALEIATQALGPEHPTTLALQSNVGERLVAVGRPEGALPLLQAALEGWHRTLGPEHPDVAITLNNLGLALDRAGRHEQALARLTEALAIRQAQEQPNPADVGGLLHNLGDVHLHERRYDVAQDHFERALAALEQALGPEHPALAFPLTGLGEVALAQGDPQRAIEPLERAQRLRDNHRVPAEVAATAFALARALAAVEPGSPRVKQLAALAEGELRRAGPGFVQRRGEVERWRSSRP